MTALIFILDLLATLLVSVFLLRFLLQQFRADFFNPVSQAIVSITNPLVMPLRRVIPGLKGMDLASLVAALIVQILVLVALFFIKTGGSIPSVGYLLVESLLSLLSLTLTIFLYAIFIRVLLSWVNPDPRNPIVSMLYSLTEPILAPARRLIPPIAGLDLSPLIVLVLIQALKILIFNDLRGLF